MKRYTIFSEQIGIEAEFYHGLVDRILDIIPNDDYECYYLAYGPPGTSPPWTSYEELDFQYTKSLVIWVVVDLLLGNHEYNIYAGDTKPHGLVGLEAICRKHPGQQFVLFAEHHDMQRLCEVDNLKIISLPPNYSCYDKTQYSYKHGYLTKQPLTKPWAAFINGPVWHRVAAASYMLSMDLDKIGYLFISDRIIDRSNQFGHIDHFLKYKVSPEMWKQLDGGFQRLKSKNFNRARTTDYIVYNERNISNYNDNLLPYYDQVKVEIITGTMFGEPTPHINEKEMQGIYGCNFILFLNTPGTVEWLRQQGFDVFDDVVNHAYNDIVDPSERLIRAFEDNIHLLDGTTNLDELWNARRERFVQNCMLADRLNETMNLEAIEQFKKVITQ
jgi:hypothetical protein